MHYSNVNDALTYQAVHAVQKGDFVAVAVCVSSLQGV